MAAKSYNEIMQSIAQLPQAAHFSERGVKRFVELRANDHRVDWHIARLAGIGGSECGVAVSAMRKEPDLFGDEPTFLALTKLLRMDPMADTGVTKFGQFAEESLRRMFLAEYGAEQDHEGIQLLTSSGSKKHGWMRYSPDDVVFIEGKRYLVDYKVPREVHAANDLPLRYRSQLHLGAMLLSNELDVEGLILVQYPLDEREMVVSQVSYDEKLAADILIANDELWYGYILEGKIPPRVDYGYRSIDLTSQEALVDACRKFAVYNAMSGVASKLADQYKTEIRKLGDRTLKGIEIGATVKESIEGTTLSASVVFDPDKAAGILSDEDRAACRMPAELDAESMAQRLRELGEDMHQFNASGAGQWDEEKLKEILDRNGHPWQVFASKSTWRIGHDKKHENSIAATKEASVMLDEAASGILGNVEPSQAMAMAA